MGTEEGHEKLKEEGEEAMQYMSNLTMMHVAFKKHAATTQLGE